MGRRCDRPRYGLSRSIKGDNADEVAGRVTRLLENVMQEWLKLRFEDDPFRQGGRLAPQGEGEPFELITTPGHHFLTKTGDYMESAKIAAMKSLPMAA